MLNVRICILHLYLLVMLSTEICRTKVPKVLSQIIAGLPTHQGHTLATAKTDFFSEMKKRALIWMVSQEICCSKWCSSDNSCTDSCDCSFEINSVWKRVLLCEKGVWKEKTVYNNQNFHSYEWNHNHGYSCLWIGLISFPNWSIRAYKWLSIIYSHIHRLWVIS